MRMSRLFLAGACAVILMAGAHAAFANDSSAEKAAGGLVLRQNRDIDMVSEDLFVSPAQVRVRYVFRNRAAHAAADHRRLPDAGPRPLYEMDSEVAYPGDFHTLVDGRPVRMSVERRAVLNGVDRTAELRRLARARRVRRRASAACHSPKRSADAARRRSSGSPASA